MPKFDPDTDAQLPDKYPILKHFIAPAAVVEHWQEGHLHELAYSIADAPTTDPAEIVAGLRKLLEAQDCFRRGLL